MDYITLGLVLGLSVLAMVLGMFLGHETRLRRDKEKEASDLKDSIDKFSKELEEEKEKNRKVVSQRKSSETRIAAAAENLIPLISELPYNSRNLRHLAQPIDFIHFDYDTPEVTFVEVKSGNSKESKRQKIIKNAIKSGLVFYEQVRISDKGINVKREENE